MINKPQAIVISQKAERGSVIKAMPTEGNSANAKK